MKSYEVFLASAGGVFLGNILFSLCREGWYRYRAWKIENAPDFEEPCWEDPERICEWPDCDRHAEYSCCYCNKHIRVDAAGFPIYHEGKILPVKPEPPKIKIVKEGL